MKADPLPDGGKKPQQWMEWSQVRLITITCYVSSSYGRHLFVSLSESAQEHQSAVPSSTLPKPPRRGALKQKGRCTWGQCIEITQWSHSCHFTKLPWHLSLPPLPTQSGNPRSCLLPWQPVLDLVHFHLDHQFCYGLITKYIWMWDQMKIKQLFRLFTKKQSAY